MKHIKRRMEIFSFYDHTGITAHLDAMARRGWALEAIGNFFWRYRAIDPAPLRHAVVYQPTASEFDSRPTEAVERFQGFCAQAGWEPVASRAQMQVYRNSDPQAIPIETDPELQVETIHRAMKKNYIPSQILMIVLSMLQYLLAFWRYELDPLGFLASSGNWVGLACYGLIMVMSAAELVTYYRWRRKALRSDRFCPTRGTQRLQRVCLVLTLVMAAVWLLTLTDGFQGALALAMLAMLLGMLALVFGIKALLKRRGASRTVIRAACWIAVFVSAFALTAGIMALGRRAYRDNWFEPEVETYEWDNWTWEAYHDPLPLYVRDLTETGYDQYSTRLEVRSSPVLKMTTASQTERVGHNGSPNLRYEIYETIFPDWIEALVVEEYTDRDHWGPRAFVETDLELPNGAVSRLWEEQDPCNTWLIRMEDRIILLRPDWELTREQLTAAVEILGQV